MFKFRPPKIEDREIFSSMLSNTQLGSYGEAFGSLFLWQKGHKTTVCTDGELLYIKYESPKKRYEFPKGKVSNQKLKKAIENLIADAKQRNYSSFELTRLTQPEVDLLQNLFGNDFEINLAEEDCEYIYKSEDLANLKGKKYHSKRNHISKFSKTHDWCVKPIDLNFKNEYINFFNKWFESHKNANQEELSVINLALKNYYELELEGIAIYVGKKIVAITLGEKINENTFDIHFEKALPEFAEAYTVINNQFSKILHEKYRFINREEDLGIPGLRKAKLSYHPSTILKKYNAIFKRF